MAAYFSFLVVLVEQFGGWGHLREPAREPNGSQKKCSNWSRIVTVMGVPFWEGVGEIGASILGAKWPPEFSKIESKSY